jgi:DNA (cytosine-5)-methyltransferase 1
MDDGRNQLFREYVRLLRGLKPKVLVMENVSEMVKGKMKLIFAEIMRELKTSGYHVSAKLMNAMYFGVPQSRQRMIFVGVREELWRSIQAP